MLAAIGQMAKKAVAWLDTVAQMSCNHLTHCSNMGGTVQTAKTAVAWAGTVVQMSCNHQHRGLTRGCIAQTAKQWSPGQAPCGADVMQYETRCLIMN